MFSTDTMTLIAIKMTRSFYAAAKAEREADVAYHAEQGHIPSHCIHGTYQWTDYDNICGGCEDGQTLLNMCAIRAIALVKQADVRMDWYMTAPGTIGSLPYDMQKSLTEWAFDGWPKQY